MKRFFWILVLSIYPLVTSAEEAESVDQVDHVALASRLVSDGHFDRAKTVLIGLPEPAEAEARADYYTILGLVALNEGAWQTAIEHMKAAMFAGKTDDVLFVYLAQAYWGLGDYTSTLLMIRNAEDHARKSAAMQLVRTQALWKLGRLHEAWEVVDAAEKKFPDSDAQRMKLFLLVELGLFQEAAEVAQDWLDSSEEPRVEDHLAFAQALLAGGQVDAAIGALELARLIFPDEARVSVQLARAWSLKGKHRVAAELLERVATTDDLRVEAAELFRKSRAFERALWVNAQIEDQPKKLRQLVGILTDKGEFERVAALESRLERVGLLEDQNVVYGLAYAHFQVGDFERSETQLKRIRDAALFETATKLREVMAFCEKNPC